MIRLVPTRDVIIALTMTSVAPRAEKLRIPGPVGSIEARLDIPASSDGRSFGVICHPHPLYGGTLDNKVVYTLARAFQELGAATLRFNFRGVSASEGCFADGIGETDDATAVAAYGRERWPGAQLWLAGFSFGGAVAIRAAVAARAAQLVTVAPAISRVDLSNATMPQCPWLIVQGDADELVDAHAVSHWAAQLARPPEIALLSGVEHFFHGRLDELRNTVLAFCRANKNPDGPAAQPGV